MARNKVAPIPQVGVGALIFDAEGRVLLVKRMNPPKAGEWHIPGGRLEPGESLHACCSREVLEETGLKVIPKTIIAIADRQIDGFHYVIIDFLATLLEDTGNQNPHQGSDALSAAWISPEELRDLPVVEGLAEVIAAGQRTHTHGAQGLFPGNGALPWLYI